MSGTGGRPESVTAEEILRYLRRSDEHVLTTPEVADGLGVSRRTALRRLSDLAEEGLVERKDVGGRASVWWVREPTIESDAPAAPLRQLVGALDEETAAEARERSNTWREAFDDELTPDDS
ncbi:MAG: helix-turn-helix domain-containing protein [Halobacteriales archaeon]